MNREIEILREDMIKTITFDEENIQYFLYGYKDSGMECIPTQACCGIQEPKMRLFEIDAEDITSLPDDKGELGLNEMFSKASGLDNVVIAIHNVEYLFPAKTTRQTEFNRFKFYRIRRAFASGISELTNPIIICATCAPDKVDRGIISGSRILKLELPAVKDRATKLGGIEKHLGDDISLEYIANDTDGLTMDDITTLVDAINKGLEDASLDIVIKKVIDREVSPDDAADLVKAQIENRTVVLDRAFYDRIRKDIRSSITDSENEGISAFEASINELEDTRILR